MKINIKYITVILLWAVCLYACKREGVLNPKDLQEEYIMTEGTTAADKFRYDFYKKYDSKILFDFARKEYFYTPTNTLDSNDKVRYISDATMHTRALQFINRHWLSYYPAAFKKKYLPFYILLADRLVDHINSASSTPDSIKYSKSNGFNSILIAGLGKRFDTMSVAIKNRLRNEAHLQFLSSYLYAAKRITLPDEFFEPSAAFYVTARTTPLATNKSDYGPAGFMIPEGTANPSGFPARGEDVHTFLKFIIEADQATVNAYIDNTAHSKVKVKFNILVNYFKNLGIDLRTINITDPTLPGTLTDF